MMTARSIRWIAAVASVLALLAIAAWLCGIDSLWTKPEQAGAAPSASASLPVVVTDAGDDARVLQGTVSDIVVFPGARETWRVTCVVGADAGGPDRYDVLVHSPAKLGLVRGGRCVVQVRPVDGGYRTEIE